MATVTTPTALNLKLRFPEFSSVDDATVTFALEEAARGVDDTWLASDINLAWLYLAAHILTVGRMGQDGGTGQRVASKTIGPISITYENPNDLPNDIGDLKATSYGRRYLLMARRNKPAIAIC